MIEFLDYPFMHRALIAGAIVGLTCSVVGVIVVLRGLSFIGAGISHAALPGVACGLLLGVSPALAALAVCCGVAVVVGAITRHGRMTHDTSIGIFYAASMAFGVMLLSLLPGNSFDLLSYLFGSVLIVSTNDVLFALAVGGGVLALLFLLSKEVLAITFDEELAEISGLPVKILSYLILVLLACVIVASIRLVGIVLASALLVTPAASALQIVRDYDRVLLTSALIGVGATELGIILSFVLDTAPGATIVVIMTAFFMLSVIAGHFRRTA